MLALENQASCVHRVQRSSWVSMASPDAPCPLSPQHRRKAHTSSLEKRGGWRLALHRPFVRTRAIFQPDEVTPY